MEATHCPLVARTAYDSLPFPANNSRNMTNVLSMALASRMVRHTRVGTATASGIITACSGTNASDGLCDVVGAECVASDTSAAVTGSD